MSEEIPLLGGRVTEGVVRVGNTVRRPRGGNAEFAEQLLLHLEHSGFAGAPRFLGVDDRGRQTLSSIEGTVPTDTWTAVFSDEELASAAQLLRRFHDATSGSDLAAGCEVVCHGDAGPWNMIWRGEQAVALIDFDRAEPGRRLDDLAYVLRKHLNLGLPGVGAGEQGRRARIVACAYGTDESGESLVAAVEDAQERIVRLARSEGWSADSLELLGREQAWLRKNADALAAAARA